MIRSIWFFRLCFILVFLWTFFSAKIQSRLSKIEWSPSDVVIFNQSDNSIDCAFDWYLGQFQDYFNSTLYAIGQCWMAAAVMQLRNFQFSILNCENAQHNCLGSSVIILRLLVLIWLVDLRISELENRWKTQLMWLLLSGLQNMFWIFLFFSDV